VCTSGHHRVGTYRHHGWAYEGMCTYRHHGWAYEGMCAHEGIKCGESIIGVHIRASWGGHMQVSWVGTRGHVCP